MIYFFKVIFGGHLGEDRNGKIYRVIAIQDNKSLSNLAKVIISSFGFDLDHCYGFYDNLADPYKSNEAYELFKDIEEETKEGALGVEHTRISKVFNEIGKKMLFLFDYGDCWYFDVELKEIKKMDGKSKYPKIKGEWCEIAVASR